jgi:hypothetical protein
LSIGARSQPRPKLGPFLETLEAWLEAEAKLPAREQRTAQRIHEALCLERAGLGHGMLS